jgi:hypothetical protein
MWQMSEAAREHRSRDSLVWLALAATACFVGGTGPAEGAEPVEAAVARLARFQESARTVQCHWASRELAPAGSLALPEFLEGPQPERERQSEDIVLNGQSAIVIDGTNVYHRREGDAWDRSEGRVPFEQTGVFANGRAAGLYSGGVGYVDLTSDSLTATENYPVLFAYRLLDPELGLARRGELRLMSRATFEGVQCLVVEQENVRHHTVDQWWLAEDMDSVPVRWFLLDSEDGDCRAEATMRYARDGGPPWALASWSIRVLDRGSLYRQFDAEVTSLTFNEPVAPETFELEFPPGTLVSDRTLQTEYTVDGAQPALQAPGQAGDGMADFVAAVERDEPGSRPARPRRRAAPIGPLAAADQIPARPESGTAWPWLIGAGLVALAAFVAALGVRRRAAR